MTAIEKRSSIAADLAYTSAALETMGSCPIWDARLTGYLGCRALVTANSEFGSLADAEYDRDLKSMLLERQHGQLWVRSPDLAALIAPYEDALEAAEETHTQLFDNPYWKASVDLAMTPSPTLQAALFKVELVRREALGDDKTMPRAPMEVVAEDFARLAQRMDDPVARYHRALDDFSAGQINEAQYSAALDALEEWAPATPTDLLRKFLAVFSDGASPHDACIARLMEQAGAIFDPATGQRRTA